MEFEQQIKYVIIVTMSVAQLGVFLIEDMLALDYLVYHPSVQPYVEMVSGQVAKPVIMEEKMDV